MKPTTYEDVQAVMEKNSEVARELRGLLADRGVKVLSQYVAKAGSIYLKTETKEGWIAKVRIADHEEKSSHVGPEVEIIVDGSGNDLADAADCIRDGEQGQF